MNEAETRAELIDLKLKQAGFGEIFRIYNNDEIIKQVKKIKSELKKDVLCVLFKS